MNFKNQIFLFAILLAVASCQTCYQGYYLNSKGTCVVGSGNCKNFTTDFTGNCLTCWDPTATVNAAGQCVSVPPNTTTDPYCQTVNQATQACTACYAGYYVSAATGLCTVANALCATLTPDGTGNCATCYPWWRLSAGNCVYP